MKLSILYRGPLSSCNYGCEYCPFAKHVETPAEHETDRLALERFVIWIRNNPQILFSIFFTPWGEALVRSRYQQALVTLTNLPNVSKAVIQTNLSCRLDWVINCDLEKLALWTTFHPTEISRKRFVNKCFDLHRKGINFSVGVVGLKEHLPEIQELRSELPPNIYLWVNAYKREPNYYNPEEIQFLTATDPLFHLNNQYHLSLGKSCRTGHSVISVDGEGTIRRCHFIRNIMGNIYENDFIQVLREQPCTNDSCGCHIGYAHLDELNLYNVFGDGILERIPSTSKPA